MIPIALMHLVRALGELASVHPRAARGTLYVLLVGLIVLEGLHVRILARRIITSWRQMLEP